MIKMIGREELAKTIATMLLRDVYRLAAGYGYEGLSEARLSSDINTVTERCANEGIAFLTETLPKLGKALDQALLGNTIDLIHSGFACDEDSTLPTFLGGLWRLVFSDDGEVLKDASPLAVKWIRQVCFVFYKLKLPIQQQKIQTVIDGFVKNELDLETVDHDLRSLRYAVRTEWTFAQRAYVRPLERVIRSARGLIERVFTGFSVLDTWPNHGPGTTARKEQAWEKWQWDYIPDRTSAVFPVDAFFFASVDHMLEHTLAQGRSEPLARVILVPKDSRGPRLISAEPKELQFLQQGLMEWMVATVEGHPLTRYSVFFTDQRPNQIGALLGSSRGDADDGYATLDLKDASDRVSLELVRLLFPEPLLGALEAVRSVGTRLPDGEELMLRKHAPMGSATCFPTMAVAIWALLAAGYAATIANDPWVRRRSTVRALEGIHVYGDDVIVPNRYVDTAIAVLEGVGLKLNLSKCCTKGFFRESCGADAFKGVLVTPLRISADWDTSTDQQRLCSYCEYSSNFNKAGYYSTGEFIARHVRTQFPYVPSRGDLLYQDAPALPDDYSNGTKLRTRLNRDLQRVEVRVLRARANTVYRRTKGWARLLRFFLKAGPSNGGGQCAGPQGPASSLDAYTERHDSVLTWAWCATPPKGGGAL